MCNICTLVITKNYIKIVQLSAHKTKLDIAYVDSFNNSVHTLKYLRSLGSSQLTWMIIDQYFG